MERTHNKRVVYDTDTLPYKKSYCCTFSWTDNYNFLENTTSRRYKYGQSTANISMTVEHLKSFLRDIDQVCMLCKSLFFLPFLLAIVLSVFFSIDGFWLPPVISPSFSWQQRLLHFMEDIYNCFWIYEWILGEFTFSYMLIVAHFMMTICHVLWMAKLTLPKHLVFVGVHAGFLNVFHIFILLCCTSE